MKGKAQLLALLAIFLAFSFFFYLSIAQEAMNSSQNLATNENSSEQSVSTNLVSEDSTSQQSVDSSNATYSVIQMNESNSEEENGTNENISTPATQISQTTEIIAKPKISLKLSTDKIRITRGESFLLRVVVSNEGSANATNVRVSVDLPKGFSTDEKEKVCGVIEVNSSCELEFYVKSDFSTQLGESEIKVRAAYE
jgi:uncharacterized repeat protein (TIGR01451 family)